MVIPDITNMNHFPEGKNIPLCAFTLWLQYRGIFFNGFFLLQD